MDENSILYPQAEVVKFLNRFVAKRLSDGSVKTLLLSAKGQNLRGLDFGCGVGTHSLALSAFNTEVRHIRTSKVFSKSSYSN